MSFQTPWMAVMFALPAIVILFYFFRKKYEQHDVSSTLLWQEHVREVQASPYLKHLQHNALLYLQLLALLLAVFAMMQPVTTTIGQKGEQAMWIVDTSATMLADELFEQHRTHMLEQLAELEQPLTLITSGKQPTVILQQETNKARIQETIEALQVTYEHEYIVDTFAFANTFITPQTVVHVYSEAVDPLTLPTTEQEVEWHVINRTKEVTNAGIEQFAFVTEQQQTDFLLQLYSTEEQALTYVIRDEQGETLYRETVTVKANDTETITAKIDGAFTLLQASIEPVDTYVVDDTYWAYQQQATGAFHVDATMHTLLHKAVTSLQIPAVTTQPADLQRAQNAVITNATALLPTHRVFLIGRDDATLQAVSGAVTTTNDRLFTFSHLEDVYVQAVYPAFEGYDTIASVGDQPFIQRSPDGDIVVLTTITETDWALQPSFPLFLWTVLDEMATTNQLFGMFTPNEQRVMATPQGDIFSQAGEYVMTVPAGNQLRAPMQPGAYTFNDGEQSKAMFVLVEAQERNIEHREHQIVGQVTATTERLGQSWLTWLIFLMLIVLVIEWEVQRRRGLSIT
ncbi:vWA domain-containing protein [Caryophanon tenue]|uniref:Aerotolerance regulator N-terminal domain-containing protein n=1 Tax=Caryophanon tenue TaxID=33978 RepID=A0A1C0YK36_9BACL|nr:BatA and WFA domain-containing protein [Caryophanon tenue]OCS87520.1 hypothetical protein A6M13_09445 [Caryophanon tenue]